MNKLVKMNTTLSLSLCAFVTWVLASAIDNLILKGEGNVLLVAFILSLVVALLLTLSEAKPEKEKYNYAKAFLITIFNTVLIFTSASGVNVHLNSQDHVEVESSSEENGLKKKKKNRSWFFRAKQRSAKVSKR